MRAKPLTKLLAFIAVSAGLYYGAKELIYLGYIPRDILKTLVPLKTQEVTATMLRDAGGEAFSAPSTTLAPATGTEIRTLVWAWNSQMGMMLANGGPSTTRGSLMEKQGVRVKLIRQDDGNQMQTELAAFATQLAGGTAQPSAGANFAIVMGDGSAAFLEGVNPQLAKLGPEYTAEIVGTTGYSRGEDKFMGQAKWKADPQSARGSLVAGVPRDGDWNIAMRWAEINKIPNNPDVKVYDPQAINWVGTNDYVDAGQKYITGYCETRTVKGTKEQKKVCVDGVVTWFPVDEQVAMQKGGLVTILSTKTAIWQMPSVIIGIKKWNSDNAEQVAGMLAAIGQGGQQIHGSAEALRAAGDISAQVYKEKDGAYWAGYYPGVLKSDLQGNQIELGGSYASNVADMLQLFNASAEGRSILKIDYEDWGKVAMQQYPDVMKEFPDSATVINPRYVQMAAGKVRSVGAAETVSYSPSTPITSIVGKRDYSINFRTGSADILENSNATLEKIAADLITSNTIVILHGHTDATGSADRNVELSRSRGDAVKAYLIHAGGKTVPGDRIRVVAHGQEDPIADNATEAGRAKNRRVQIVLGNQ